MEKIVNDLQYRYAGSKIYYLPHREENETKIAKVNQIENLHILHVNMPFEIYIIENPELPTCIASFYSGALNTAKILLENQSNIFSYRLKASELRDFRNKKEILKNIESSYSNLELQNIEIIDIL